MRTIQTFVLKLMIDSADLERLRGSLQSVSGSQTYPFADEQALLALLHEFAARFGEADSAERLQPAEQGREEEL